MVGNKRGKKEKKTKEKSVGTWVEEKKRGGGKKGRRVPGVERKKKEIISQYFHNKF